MPNKKDDAKKEGTVAKAAEEAPKKTTPAKEERAERKPEKKAPKNVKNPFSYEDPLQAKLVNCIMHRGKKAVAQRILKHTFDELISRGETNPLKMFEAAIENAKPSMEVKPRRVGGAIYQIPIEVPPKRQQSLSLRWILEGARKRKGQPMHKRLAGELMDASSETGFAYTKKEDAHRMAQANKAFAHLARY